MTFVFLETMFVPVGLDLAIVALWFLSACAGLVGLSLGVLLPTLLPGICFGISLALLVGVFVGVSNALYLPVVGGILSLVGVFFASRYVPNSLVVVFLFFLSHVSLQRGQQQDNGFIRDSTGNGCRGVVLCAQANGRLRHGYCQRIPVLPERCL